MKTLLSKKESKLKDHYHYGQLVVHRKFLLTRAVPNTS